MNLKLIYSIGFLLWIAGIAYVYNIYDLNVALWAFQNEYSSLYNFAKLIGHASESQYWLLLFALIALYYYQIDYNKSIMIKARFIIISIITSGIGGLILKVLFGKARPYVYKNSEEFGFTYFNTNYDYFSFPSGHTTTAFSLAVALSLMFPRFTPLFLIYAVSMASSRVVEFMHYPSDVMAGALLGTSVTLFLYHKSKISFK